MYEKKPPGIMLYFDQLRPFSTLTDEEYGEVIRAVVDYAETGNVCELRSEKADLAFRVLQNIANQDKEKYRAKCERNRINGRKGGRPKGKINQTVSEKANNNDNYNVNSNINSNNVHTGVDSGLLDFMEIEIEGGDKCESERDAETDDHNQPCISVSV